MRTIKTYSKGAPFYNAFIRLQDVRRALASVYKADFPEPRLWTLSSSSHMS